MTSSLAKRNAQFESIQDTIEQLRKVDEMIRNAQGDLSERCRCGRMRGDHRADNQACPADRGGFRLKETFRKKVGLW